MLIKRKNGCSWFGEAISEAKYREILALLRDSPEVPEGFSSRLTADLTWEQFERPAEEEPELTETEALEILLGGAV